MDRQRGWNLKIEMSKMFYEPKLNFFYCCITSDLGGDGYYAFISCHGKCGDFEQIYGMDIRDKEKKCTD